MRYTEDMIPEGYRLEVKHLHDGNSTHPERVYQAATRIKATMRPRYVTFAMIYKVDGGPRQRDPLVCWGHAFCSPKDSPSRKVGRQIAVARAIKELIEYTELGLV